MTSLSDPSPLSRGAAGPVTAQVAVQPHLRRQLDSLAKNHSSWQCPPGASKATPPPWLRPRGHCPLSPTPTGLTLRPGTSNKMSPSLHHWTKWVPRDREAQLERGRLRSHRTSQEARPGQPPLSPARSVPRVAWEPGVPQTDPSAESPGPLPAGSPPAQQPQESRPFTPQLLRSLPTPGSAGCVLEPQTLCPDSGWSQELEQLRPDSNQLGSGGGDAAPGQHTANTSWARHPCPPRATAIRRQTQDPPRTR